MTKFGNDWSINVAARLYINKITNLIECINSWVVTILHNWSIQWLLHFHVLGILGRACLLQPEQNLIYLVTAINYIFIITNFHSIMTIFEQCKAQVWELDSTSFKSCTEWHNAWHVCIQITNHSHYLPWLELLQPRAIGANTAKPLIFTFKTLKKNKFFCKWKYFCIRDRKSVV